MRFSTAGSLLKDTFNDWLDDRAMSLAASLAFYTVLSLVAAAHRGRLVRGPRLRRGRRAVLLFGASGVFSELQDSMNAIWQVKLKPGRGVVNLVRARFFSFAMVLGVAFLLLVSLLLSAALNIVGALLGARLPGGVALWSVANFGISFAAVSTRPSSAGGAGVATGAPAAGRSTPRPTGA